MSLSRIGNSLALQAGESEPSQRRRRAENQESDWRRGSKFEWKLLNENFYYTKVIVTSVCVYTNCIFSRAVKDIDFTINRLLLAEVSRFLASPPSHSESNGTLYSHPIALLKAKKPHNFIYLFLFFLLSFQINRSLWFWCKNEFIIDFKIV